MSKMLYFSYGSNMSTPRLTGRVPSARVVAVGKILQHKLAFHKKSRDESAKCDAVYTRDPRDIVYGVVFEISASEKPELDKKEGLGIGYEEKRVSVTVSTGKTYEAVTYFATDIDPRLKPYHWYKEHVLRGAREHRLPPDYIAGIQAISSMPDPDRRRHDGELSIYN